MAIGSGLGAQLGIAAEVTYGSYVAPSKFVEFTKAGLQLKKTTAQSAGIAAGRLLPLGSRRVVTQRQASGGLGLEVTTKHMGLLLQTLMGTTVTPVQQGATSAYLQTHTLADTAGKSLSVQVGMPLTTGTVVRKNFLGCKITSGEFSCGVGEMLVSTFEFDSKNVEETSALAAASYPAMSVFHFGQMALKVGTYGAEVAADGIRKVSIKVERPQATERFYAGADGLKAEPITNDQIKITGTIEMDYVSPALDDLHTSDAGTSLVWEFVGNNIAGAFDETFRIVLPEVHFDDAPPTVDGPDVIKPTLTFTAVYDGTNQPRIEYMSSDVTL
ncbi:phage tail tube protein [Streptomyces exfoliatus]|uniref:Phage tail tube protein n=1 Tax=Streptomyces exfoliatus TaxID=1905 RepID=A0ABV3CUQ8_STREX